MHLNFLVFCCGLILASYGALIVFSPRFATYINKISINKHVLSEEFAKYSIWYFEGAMSLGAGAALMAVAFFS